MHRYLRMPALIGAATALATSASADTGRLPEPQLLYRVDLSPFADSADYYRAHAQFGDLNNDGHPRDFIRFVNSNRMQAFAYDGADGVELLWEYEAPIDLPDPPNRYFFKYLIWDVDLDGETEVVGGFASESGQVEMRILDAATGAVERSLAMPIDNPWLSSPARALRLKVFIGNLRGLETPQDIVLLEERASNGDIWVFDADLNVIWDTLGDHDEKKTIYTHYPWLFDVDADGRDEIVGSWVLDDDGSRLARLTPWSWHAEDHYWDHIDIAMIDDFLPERPGLELIYSHEWLQAAMVDAATFEPIWSRPHDHADVMLYAVGEYDLENPGPELVVFEPDREASLILDVHGNLLAETDELRRGFNIDWDGDRSVDELFNARRGAVIDVMAGIEMRVRDAYRDHAADQQADGMRLYMHALDLVGDYREEVIAFDENEMLVFGASGEAPADLPSPWTDPAYRQAIANMTTDNHTDRLPRIDWQTMGLAN